MSAPTFRDDRPEPAQQTPVDERLMSSFTRALQLANEQGSATVGYRDSDAGSDIVIGYDVTVVRIGGDTPTAGAKPATPPTIGLDVLYTLNEADAAAINKRRTDYAAFQRTLDGQPEPGARGATGHVAHVGNRASAGDMCPAQVVNTFGGPAANLQVTLDGTDSYWATSRTEGAGPGHWAVLPTAQ